MSTSYNSQANIGVTNNCSQDATITLSWKYSDDPVGSSGGMPVTQGQTSSYNSVGYNTGFGRTGGSWWQIQVVLADGATYINDPYVGGEQDWYRCDLDSDDNGQNLTFSVTESQLFLNMHGSCQTDMGVF